MTDPTDLAAALEDLVVLDDRDPRTPADAVARDRELAREVGRGARPPTYRIWENGRALVVTARETRLPDFAAAARAAAHEGWPVVERDSGGTAVPHGPGILQASLLLPQDRLGAHALEGIYRALSEPVRRALEELGLEPGFGEVEGSFCDGRHNLVAGGRKIAGTSQRWTGGLPPASRAGAYVVAHMVLFVDGDLTEATEAINRLYARAGETRRFRPDAVTTVAGLLGGEGGRGLVDRVRRSLARHAAGLGAA